jgi:hypothetical protein
MECDEERMEPSTPRLLQTMLEVVDNQITSGDPPEARETLDRLKALGYSDFDARRFIGTAVAVEIFQEMKHKTPFDLGRYVRNLARLPKEPQK